MIAVGIAMLIGLGAAVAQHVYWTGRVQREVERANQWRDLHDERVDDLTDARRRTIDSARQGRVTGVATDALTNDLTKTRQANIILWGWLS